MIYPPTKGQQDGGGLESTFGRGAVAFRRRVAFGGLLAVVVLVALGCVLAWRQYDDSKHQSLNELHARVALAATVFNTAFSGRISTLEAIADAPEVRSGDTATMAAYFRRIQAKPEKEKLFNGGLGWIDRSGMSRASDTSPNGAGVYVGDRDYFVQAVKGKPFISEGLTSRIRRTKVVVMAVPTRDAAGRISGVLAGSSEFKRSSTNKRGIDLGFKGLTVLDRSGQEVTLSSFQRPPNQALVEKIRTGEGVLSGVKGLHDGNDRVVAYANSPIAGWTTVLDRPSSEVFASARRTLVLELVVIAVAAAVVLGLLGWALVRTRRELETEREHMRRWDELSQSLGEASAPAEVTGALISALATAFPRACLVVALEAEDRPGLTIAAVRPGDDGLTVDRDDPLALELALLSYDAAGVVSAGDPEAVHELVPELPAQLAEQVGSIYAVPLLTRSGRAIGSITLLLPDEQTFDRTDESLVAAQADYAGRALTRAQRYAQEHDVAVALQRSLLPDALPTIDGVDLAGRYSAGGVGLEVGGDWYDALRRPDGIVHLTVGDVAGRGIGAAVLMGQLRNAYRALAYEHTSPAEIARRLLRHVPDAGMATAVFLAFDPYTGTLAYSSAGHPPALLHDGATGAVTDLDRAASPPLGWAEGAAVREERLELNPASTLLVYTDGLVERRGASIDDGISLLRSLLADNAERPARLACDAVLNSVLSASPADDDMALLLVRVTEVPSELAIEVPSEPAAMRTVRMRVGTWLDRRGVGDDQRADTVLAITEACNNAIEHGYRGEGGGTIRLRLEHRAGRLAITIEDDGRWREPRPDPTRGRGLVIMRSTMHRAEITPTDAGTRVELELHLPGGRVAPLAPRTSAGSR